MARAVEEGAPAWEGEAGVTGTVAAVEEATFTMTVVIGTVVREVAPRKGDGHEIQKTASAESRDTTTRPETSAMSAT